MIYYIIIFVLKFMLKYTIIIKPKNRTLYYNISKVNFNDFHYNFIVVYYV